MKIRTFLKFSRKTQNKHTQMTEGTVKSNLPLIVIKVFVNKFRPGPGQRQKINLNFYFHTSLWCFNRFHEGLKDLY